LKILGNGEKMVIIGLKAKKRIEQQPNRHFSISGSHYRQTVADEEGEALTIAKNWTANIDSLPSQTHSECRDYRPIVMSDPFS
jgi:hypothetical protein